jgi:hypothetical protein
MHSKAMALVQMLVLPAEFLEPERKPDWQLQPFPLRELQREAVPVEQRQLAPR